MLRFSVLFLAALVALASSAPNKDNSIDSALRFKSFEDLEKLPSLDKVWQDFKIKHNKDYGTEEEEAKRKTIFGDHLKQIEMHNYLHAKGAKSYRLGINEYADLAHHEFVAIMNGLRPRPVGQAPNHDHTTYMSPLAKVQMPSEVDWRKEGYVTDVKNQGRCGSCWSFSTTGSLEGQHFRKTGKLVSLSEQNLVDCSASWGNNGCNGGLMDNAFQYIKDNDGLDTEASYPYLAEQKKCHFKTKNIGATDAGYVDVPSQDEDKLKEALATIGPVSVAIDASHKSFQLYESGVYDEPECSSTALDHGVLAVGYGTSDDGIDYWIIKNSWGPTWGDQGYVKMVRNKDNQCGVATQASYPLV